MLTLIKKKGKNKKNRDDYSSLFSNKPSSLLNTISYLRGLFLSCPLSNILISQSKPSNSAHCSKLGIDVLVGFINALLILFNV